ITGSVLDNLSGVQVLEASIDGGAPQSVVFDQTGKFALALNLPTDGSADGQHTVSFVATDAAGNVTTPLNLSVVLATKAPMIAPATIQDGTELAAGSVLQGFALAQSGATLAGFSYTFDAGTPGAVTMPVSFDPSNGLFNGTLDLSRLGAGAHTLTLTAIDNAG